MITYKPLKETLKKRNMTMAELRVATKMAPNTLTCFYQDRNVSMNVLNRVCNVLDCTYNDVVEFTKD